MVYNLNKNLESLFRFDKVRILKILEITQYSVLAFFIGMFFGDYLDKNLPDNDKNDSKSKIVLEVLFNLFMVVVFIYYIQKIIALFPFIFGNIKGYIPSKKNESLIGITIGMGLIFNITQRKLYKNVHLLTGKEYNPF